MYRTLASSFLSLTAAAAFTVMATTQAHAQSGCASDADCPQGLVCEVVGGTGCAVPACPPGETCPEPEPCVPEEFTECVPGPCATDADCAPGLTCLTSTTTSCTDTSAPAPACEPGTECFAPPPAPEPVCEEITESYCVPDWIAPCDVDADCGEGFQCVANEMCECSGSAPVPDPGSSDPLPPPEETCTCEPTGTNRCEPLEVVCASDADCLADWTCVSDSEEICTVSSDSDVPVCEVVNPESYCMPPFWDLTLGSDSSDSGSGEVYASDPTATPAPTGQDAAARATADSSDSEGGCSVSGGSPAPTPAWLLLGLVGLLSRRRRLH